MARIAIVIFSIGTLFAFWAFGRPLYWRFYATTWRPFEDPTIGNSADSNGVSASSHQRLKPSETPKIEVKVERKPFDINAFPLTKERVHGFLQDGYIMVTWANHHYLDFAKTWVYHVKRAGINAYMVGAMDDEMLKSLWELESDCESQCHTWRMNTGITKDDLGWGSPNFHKMGRAKISLIKQFLELDVIMVISDIDTAWLKNPLPYFGRYSEADILTSTDQLGPTVQDDSLEKWPEAGASFNIGIMMFRPKSMEFVNEWIKSLENPQMWDQTAFNDLARAGGAVRHQPEMKKNLWKGDNNKLTIGILPSSIFASGHTFFVQTKYKEYGLEPYVAHATFQYSGTPGKRNRFREFLLWEDPPEYFTHPKGFIHLNLEVPKEMLAKSKGIQGPMVATKLFNHFDLVHWQLFRIRTGLALATLTGRVLVLPPIWCEVDKYWAPLYDGNIPGSQFIKPFICPMDHILDIEGWWHRKLSPDFGPHIEWREYSFFKNPRLTPEVNNSRLVMKACGSECPQDVAKATDVKDGAVSVKPSVDVPRLREVLNSPSAASYKVLEVGNAALDAMMGIWNTFPGEEQPAFTRRLKHLTSVVCCLSDNPGWVWYSFLADVPHEDRFNRKQDGGRNYTYYRGDGNVVAAKQTA